MKKRKNIEICEDDSMIIDDEFCIMNFYFYPEEKQFTINTSIKDDCFFIKQEFEYKISKNPIEIYIRVLECSSEPPLKYTIKDGVVLESIINNPIKIEELKKDVEWHKISVSAGYEVCFYILSKHPEIISKIEYRKFLRESAEKIKLGIKKMEEIIKKNTLGLKINIDEYGQKYIYNPSIKSSRKERIEYCELSEEKRKKSKYGKKIKHVEDFKESLFKENSSKYVGISEDEFRNSTELLKYIENLLEEKNISTEKNKIITTKNSYNKMRWIVILISVLALYKNILTAIIVFIIGNLVISIISEYKK